MSRKRNSWSDLDSLKQDYLKLHLQDVIDYEKFCMVSIIWHSTKIEGCSLTETDTRILLDKDITAAGKPLKDHLMIKDHYYAFQFIAAQAKQKRKLSIGFIREAGALVMQNTGAIINSVAGNFDTSKGDLRLVQVYVNNKYFPDYKKVPALLDQLCNSINENIENAKSNDILKLAADVHYNLVNIHPFGDGNGRTARLFMNYIQLYHNEPLVKLFSEDRAAYINALNETELHQEPEIFRTFIASQQVKFLKAEIKKFRNLDKNYSLII